MFQNNGYPLMPTSGQMPRFPFPPPFMQLPSPYNTAATNQQQPMATTSSYSAPPISFPHNPSFFPNPPQNVWPNTSMFTRPPPSFETTSIASAPPIWPNQQFRYPPPVQQPLIPQSAMKTCVVLIRDPKQFLHGTSSTSVNETFFRNWMYDNLKITMHDVSNSQVVSRDNYYAGFFTIQDEQKRQNLLNYSTNGLPVNGVYIRSAESVILETAWAVSTYRNNGPEQAPPTDINDAMKALAIATSPTTEMTPQQFSFLRH